MSVIAIVYCVVQLYPDLKQHCNPIASKINNFTCNPPEQTKFTSDVTAYCSGFDYGNEDESWTFYNQPVSYCTLTVSFSFRAFPVWEGHLLSKTKREAMLRRRKCMSTVLFCNLSISQRMVHGLFACAGSLW